MRYLGLDPATHLGFSIFEDNNLLMYGLGDFTKYKDNTERIHQIKLQTLELIEKYEPDMIGIEDIQMQRNPQVFKFLSKLQGVLLDLFHELQIPYEVIPPSVWRKTCGIKTKGVKRVQLKKDALDFVERMFNITGDLDDIAESICQGWHMVKKHNKENY